MTTILGWTVAAAFLVAPFGLACDSTDADTRVLARIDDALRLENDAIAIVCDCWEELGEASRSACLDDQILPSQRRCIEDAYLRESAAAQLYLECLVPLIGELNACLDEKLACEDPGPTAACFDDFDLGLRECVALPNSVQRGLDECYAGAGINNGGGEGDDGMPAADGGGEDPAPGTWGGDDDGSPTPGTGTGNDGDGEGTGAFECPEGDFVCSDDRCIPAASVCDGDSDCSQGEDELECAPAPGDGGEEGGEPLPPGG